MTRGTPHAAYDEDFFAWTQDQATALRRASQERLRTHVDILHLAEEIEDLGKRDLREVETLLERIVENLLKIVAQPESRDIPHWRSETRHFQRSARKAFSPSMRRLFDKPQIWRDGCRAADAYLADVKARSAAPGSSPFTLDELLSADFDIDSMLIKLSIDKTEP